MIRKFAAPDGRAWEARIVSHGRSSSYLNPKVHRPIVQFSCLDRKVPRRYASLPPECDALVDLDDSTLLRVFSKARSH